MRRLGPLEQVVQKKSLLSVFHTALFPASFAFGRALGLSLQTLTRLLSPIVPGVLQRRKGAIAGWGGARQVR